MGGAHSIRPPLLGGRPSACAPGPRAQVRALLNP